MSEFSVDLRWSNEHEPFWANVYDRVFPNIAGQQIVKDETLQGMGIDRYLVLADGRLVYIEEKAQRKTYPTILLEYLSNPAKGTPGWIEKNLQCDFLAYAFIPTKTCYLFPWRNLQAIWFTYRSIFMSKAFQTIKARISPYTESKAIPVELLKAIVKNTVEVNL